MTIDPYRTVTDLSAAIGRREVSSRELLDCYLERVDRFDGDVNAVVARSEQAAERAAAADGATARGESWGPLHGIPMTIKDSFAVAGMPTTSGSPDLAGYVPDRNAVAVQRLVDAGAVVYGKTNLPLFAGDFQSYNAVYGTTNNPWDLERVPGGSSGGSAAALAAGFTPLELGSDIGGSIRNPAHYCGVFGHKPTYGIVPMAGHIPGPPGTARSSDLAVAGPLARSAEDLELALDVVAGPDADVGVAWRLDLPPARRDRLDGFRVAAWMEDPHGPVAADVAEVLAGAVAALEEAGARVDHRARPDISSERANFVYNRLLLAETSAGFPSQILARYQAVVSTLDESDHSTTAAQAIGAVQSHRKWLSADESRHRMRQAWAAFFEDFDVVLAPIMPTAAFVHDHRPMAERTVTVDGRHLPYWDQIFWAGLAAMAYLPAAVVPAGLTASGLPVGLQIIGPYLEDRTPLRFAGAAAEVLGGFRPPPGYAE